MLILTRRINQSVLVTMASGEEIEVMLCQVKGRQVRLGITAPRDAEIARVEAKPLPQKEADEAQTN